MEPHETHLLHVPCLLGFLDRNPAIDRQKRIADEIASIQPKPLKKRGSPKKMGSRNPVECVRGIGMSTDTPEMQIGRPKPPDLQTHQRER